MPHSRNASNSSLTNGATPAPAPASASLRLVLTAMNTTADTPTALRQIADLPHPPMRPFLGNAGQITKQTIHQDVERWARQFGKLFRMRFVRRDILVVADHALLAEVMRDRPDGWRRNPQSSLISREMGLPGGVFSAEGEAWRNQRRVVMAGFAPNNIRQYFPQMTKVTTRLQARWRKAALSGAVLSLQPELMRYTVDTIAGLALGDDINTLESGDEVIQQHLDKVLPAVFRRVLSALPYWRWFKTRADRELEQSVAVINSEIARFIAQARQQLATDPSLREKPRNLLQAMLIAADVAAKESTEFGFDDAAVAGNVLTMLLAGEDTTANTVAWMIYLLHRNPACLKRLSDEVMLTLGEAAGKPEMFTPELMDSMSYLDACINEAMRLKPVAPFLSLQALQDTQIADVQVPKGTILWGVLRHDSVSETYFQNPDVFEPSRWMAEEAATTSVKSNNAKRVAMPFGAGPRVCPGRYLALLEMKMSMSMLLSSFAITSVDTPDGGEAQEGMYFTMSPQGLTMRLTNLQL
jgi:cytochrome P450